MILDIRAPDSRIVRQAEELVRTISSEMLFNHVMRCYWFGELFAQQEGSKADRELMDLAKTHALEASSSSDRQRQFSGQRSDWVYRSSATRRSETDPRTAPQKVKIQVVRLIPAKGAYKGNAHAH